MGVGDWIKKMRDSAGWSQNDLSFKAHIPVRNIQRWEAGVGEPNASNLAKLASAFGIALPFAAATKGRYPWSFDSTYLPAAV